jgi:hypothetical protein
MEEFIGFANIPLHWSGAKVCVCCVYVCMHDYVYVYMIEICDGIIPNVWNVRICPAISCYVCEM